MVPTSEIMQSQWKMFAVSDICMMENGSNVIFYQRKWFRWVVMCQWKIILASVWLFSFDELDTYGWDTWYLLLIYLTVVID